MVAAFRGALLIADKTQHTHTFPCAAAATPCAPPAPVVAENLRRDIQGMHPDSTDPVPITWDMTAYDSLVLPNDETSTAAERDSEGRLAPWLAAFPEEELLETNIRRQNHRMGLVANDARWQIGKFVVLEVEAGASDEFWVGRVTRKPWVVREEGGDGDMAKLEVQWYVPVRGGGNYRGWLHAMVGDDKKPCVDVQDIISVIMGFEPNEAGQGHKAGYVKVPGAVFTKVQQWRGTHGGE